MRTLLKNANVITMESHYVVENTDLLIEDGKIERVSENMAGKAEVVIDCTGKYIMPGLCDAHFHTEGKNVDDLRLALANGITCVRNMWGFEGVLRIRESTKEKSVFLPDIYTACNILDGNPPVFQGMTVVETREQARKAVMTAKEEGYDFIKVYNNLSMEAYEEIIKTSNEIGMDVIGHTPVAAGPEKAIEMGQFCFEHAKAMPKRLLEKLAESGAYFTPTLVTLKMIKYIQNGELSEAWFDKFPANYMTKQAIEDWKAGAAFFKDYDFKFDRTYEDYVNDIMLYHNSGGKLLCGTDVPFPPLVFGFALFDEMEIFSEAGLSNYEVLKTATVNCYESMHKLDTEGTITEGKNANLVILKENPLDNLKALRNIEAVVIRGEYYNRSNLDTVLEEIEETCAASKR